MDVRINAQIYVDYTIRTFTHYANVMCVPSFPHQKGVSPEPMPLMSGIP